MLDRVVTSREIDVIRKGLHVCFYCSGCSGCPYREFKDCFKRLCYDAYVLIGELDEQNVDK